MNDSIYEYNLQNKFIQLSKDIEYLLNNNFCDLDLDYFRDKYYTALYMHGLANLRKRISNNKKIAIEMTAFHSEEFLRMLDSCITIKKTSSSYWFNRLLRNNGYINHPLRHILFIEFLTESVQNFIQNIDRNYEPFGTGPWPCLNTAAEHYKELVVTEFQYSNSTSYQNPKGNFICKCGYIYLVHSYIKNKDTFLKKKVVEYGPIWENTLKTYILTKKTDMGELSRIFECDMNTIRNYAKKLEVIHLLNTRYKPIQKKVDTIEKVKKYKKEIENYKMEHPNCTRSELYLQNRRQCKTLSFYDSKWLDNILPQPFSHLGEQKDLDFCVKVQNVINSIKNDKNRTRHITLALINESLDFKIGKQHSIGLPRTYQLINSNLETNIEFKKKKIDYAIQDLLFENKTSTYFKIAKKVGLNSTSMPEELKQYIKREINRINLSNFYSLGD